MYKPLDEWQFEIFHVHTKRCHHATGEDTEYIEKAIELGAKRIVFTDHAPFPGDPFGNRMAYSEYQEYVDTMCQLSEQYRGQIEVLKGLEIEYLPSFKSYYEELRADQRLDVLVLGQHFYEVSDREYSFSMENRYEEYKGMVDAICDGAATGYFDVLAHPDRAFKRCKQDNAGDISNIIVCMSRLRHCLSEGMKIEYNYASCFGDDSPWFTMFWQRAKDLMPICSDIGIFGYDAHSISEMAEYYEN